MKKKKIATLIVILIATITLKAQHTKRFQQITANFKPVDTTYLKDKYKNGNKKQEGYFLKYETNEYEYSRRAGKHTVYYYSGGIMIEAFYDQFGIPLKWKHYNSFGQLLEEAITISIDTNEKNMDLFLSNDKSYTVVILERKYKFSPKICDWFLYKEGKRENGKKIGQWKKFTPFGDLKKLKTY